MLALWSRICYKMMYIAAPACPRPPMPPLSCVQGPLSSGYLESSLTKSVVISCPTRMPFASYNDGIVSWRVPGKVVEAARGYVVRRELAEFVAHHLLGNGHVMVDLAIVHLELETNEVGQDGC